MDAYAQQWMNIMLKKTNRFNADCKWFYVFSLGCTYVDTYVQLRYIHIFIIIKKNVMHMCDEPIY